MTTRAKAEEPLQTAVQEGLTEDSGPAPLTGDFYDEAYFKDGSKSNYNPYGPGAWADWLTEMIVTYDGPRSILDVGCAYGYLVERFDRKGVQAWGFDISDYAISVQGFRAGRLTWVGSVDDEAAWRRAGRVDLVIATELMEHLTEAQALRTFELGYQYGNRMLCLIAIDLETGPGAHEGDLSHITVKPKAWWEALARRAGWKIGDASPYNEDTRSQQMSWAGRFFRLQKEV